MNAMLCDSVGGATLPADMVLMACGGVANDDVARTAGLACDGGVVVDAYGRTSAPDVYAAGDCARFPSPRYARTIRLESVQNAIDQARCVAQAIAGKLTVYDPLPWFRSDQFDTKLQIAGLSDEHTRSVVRGLPSTGSFSVEYYKGDALIAVDAINDAKAMIEKIKDKGAECVWVGPPQAALSYMPETRFKDFVEKFSLGIEEAGCRYVSSLDKTDRGNINDSMGLHYSKKDAERWGEKVAKELGPLVDAALTAVRPQAPATSEAPVR